MAFGNFGPDPTMVTMMTNIGNEIINQMVNNGTIQNDVGNWLINQLNMNAQVILNSIVQTASQNNVQVDASVIQSVLSTWISNLLKSYMAQRQASMQQQQYGYGRPLGAGYGYGYGNPMYGVAGYGQPPMQPIQPVYNNPSYANPAVVSSGYGTGAAANGGYGNPSSYVSQTSVQTENANRFTANRPEPNTTAPGTNKPKPSSGIAYTGPQPAGDTKEIKEPSFNGIKCQYRLDLNKYMIYLHGTVSGVKRNAAEVFKVIKDKLGDKGFFAQVLVNQPKVIDAPMNEVASILSKYEALFRAKIQKEVLSMDSIRDTFTAFHVEFMQEKSDAAKAIEKYIISEFNELIATNCLNANEGGYLTINSFEDVMELYSENTKSEFIQKRQAHVRYKSVLGNLVLRAVAALFMQTSGYRIMSINDPDDREVIAKLFADESINGLSVTNSIFALKKSIDTKHIDGAEGITALYKLLAQKTVVAVPRTLVFSNLAPEFWITGDYSKPQLARMFVEPTNALEFCIVKAHKALNKESLPTVTNMYLDYGNVRYRLTYGVTTESAFFVEIKE